MSDGGLAAGVGELTRPVAGTVVGEHGFEVDAEPGIAQSHPPPGTGAGLSALRARGAG